MDEVLEDKKHIFTFDTAKIQQKLIVFNKNKNDNTVCIAKSSVLATLPRPPFLYILAMFRPHHHSGCGGQDCSYSEEAGGAGRGDVRPSAGESSSGTLITRGNSTVARTNL